MEFLYRMFVWLMTYLDRYRVIYDRMDDEPYLERFYILIKDRKIFPFNVFIHRFLKSDPDDLHDHPWSYRSLILYGGYWEYTETGKKWRGFLSYKYAPANTFHRIELDDKMPYCWSLFIAGKCYRDWGFKTGGGWVQNEEYFKNKKENKKME